MKPEYVRLYSEAYTEQQIDDMLTFYRSSTGQAMVAKTPDLMAKSSVIVQQRVMAARPEMQKLIQEFTDRARSSEVPPDPK
jgi:hypothetical protein